jgi:hypothetical protein
MYFGIHRLVHAFKIFKCRRYPTWVAFIGTILASLRPRGLSRSL